MMSDTKSPWSYLAFQNDSSPEEFGKLETFVQLWRSKWPRSNCFPCWRDFDPLEFEGWWGQVSLAEISYNPVDLRWVLWGTTITNWWGSDYTNKKVSEISNVSNVWENFERGYLERLIDERLIGFVSGSLSPQKRGYIKICGVDLPLEKDGNISHILSAYFMVDKATQFTPALNPLFQVGSS